jgi:nucleoside-diphosphate-sugar epimerase
LRIFLAGATGAVGQRLIPLLAGAGHSTIGLTRSPEKAPLLRRLGAEAIVADALDRRAIAAAVLDAKPEAMVHEMTDLKAASDLRAFDRSFAATNRLRTEATDHLLAAARAAGVGRFLAQSFCGWPYARVGGAVKTEDDPLDPNPPKELSRTLAAIRYLEAVVTQSSSPAGIVLRYGAFYGDHTGLFDGPLLEQIRRRRAPLIGSGNGWWSFVHIDDAAQATALAIERGVGGAVYNIVDDEPAPVREWLPVLGKLLAAKPPRHLPAWLARILGGEHLVVMMTEARAGSNAKAKAGLGWRPGHASWRTGFRDVVERLQLRPAA